MIDAEKRKRFVELRSKGMSYIKISKEIGVCKNTLMGWSLDYINDIKTAKTLELEAIREEFLIGRKHRLRVLGSELNKITSEILNRDLIEVPTWRLFELQEKINIQIENEGKELEY